MLLYHFGSREGLLIAVARAVEEAQRAAVPGWGVTPAAARRAWKHFSDPKLWPQERLFFELYSHALLGRRGTEGFLETVVEPWITYIAAALADAGADETTARADARLAVAITCGLLLDLLATGDREGVTEAFERYLRYAEPPASPAEQPAQPPDGAVFSRMLRKQGRPVTEGGCPWHPAAVSATAIGRPRHRRSE
jgi:AcrR family transcriptional regulator